MAKAEKVEIINSFTEIMKDKELVFFNYEGINVSDLTDIRKKVRENGGEVKVIKNTYLKMVLSNLKIEADDSIFHGMNAVAIINENFSSVAKIINDAQKAKKVIINAGFYDGNIIDKDYVIKLASIPSREVLYGMLVGCLQGPVANLAYTLQAISENKGETSES